MIRKSQDVDYQKKHIAKVRAENFDGLTKSQYEIREFILSFTISFNRPPYVYEICDLTGMSAKSIGKILKNLNMLQDEKYHISPFVKSLFDAFEDGMTILQLSEKTGVDYASVYQYSNKLIEMGANIVIDRRFQNECEV